MRECMDRWDIDHKQKETYFFVSGTILVHRVVARRLYFSRQKLMSKTDELSPSIT